MRSQRRPAPRRRSRRRGEGRHPAAIRIGLISDTHGLLRPEATAFLRGCDRIIHAGDIGDPRILDDLAAIAPVTAVRGNNDQGAWAEALPETQLLRVGGIGIYVLHERALLDIEPAAAGVQVIVSGHSHQPLIEEREGVIHVNPGSSGRRRFRLPVSVGELVISGTSITPRVVTLQVGGVS